MKLCKDCNLNPRYGKTSYCRNCTNARAKVIRDAQRAGTYVSMCRKPRLNVAEREQRVMGAREYQKWYRATFPEKVKLTKNAYLDRVKFEGITAYGGRCTCCGEGNPYFLTVEHLNGRKDEPKKITGKKAWQRLKKLGFPKDDYTLLCFNCNCAKGAYGSCPHTWKDGHP